MVCRDFILPEGCKPCLLLFAFQFAKIIVPYQEQIDLTRAGLKGSPTKVKKTFVPQKKTGGVKIREASNEDSARKLFQLLSGSNVI